MKLKALVIEIGIKNISDLRKNLKVKKVDFIFASSFLDVVDIIHLDKVHAIIFSDFRGSKSTVGYIKMFKTTNPDFKLIVLSNDKKISDGSKNYYIQRGAEIFLSSYDVRSLMDFFTGNISRILNEKVISSDWSRCTKKAIRCLKDHYDKNSSILEFVAHKSSYSSSSVSHCVKKDTGESFMEWAQKLRVNGAIELLKSTEHSLSVISNQVGYKTIQGLAKAFKKVTGKPPSFYRKKAE